MNCSSAAWVAPTTRTRPASITTGCITLLSRCPTTWKSTPATTTEPRPPPPSANNADPTPICFNPTSTRSGGSGKTGKPTANSTKSAGDDETNSSPLPPRRLECLVGSRSRKRERRHALTWRRCLERGGGIPRGAQPPPGSKRADAPRIAHHGIDLEFIISFKSERFHD